MLIVDQFLVQIIAGIREHIDGKCKIFAADIVENVCDCFCELLATIVLTADMCIAVLAKVARTRIKFFNVIHMALTWQYRQRIVDFSVIRESISLP